jgi:hypothetical protein
MASVQKELVATHFNNIIRLIHQVDRERVLWLRNVSFNTLRRLGVKRDVSKAIGKLPAGSDQCDLGSIRTWMDKVQPTDLVAVAQVVAIDATAVSRTG